MSGGQPCGALLAVLALAGACSANGQITALEPACPGALMARGIGNVSLVPTGWGMAEEVPQVWLEEDTIAVPMGSRSYFAAYCTAGKYNISQYQAWDLRGKTLVYTTDLSHAGCGCNAAFYLTSMRHNDNPSECGDHYCDSNRGCGESCTEIDIQEGNRFSWHSTLHGSRDPGGMGKGYGGGGFGWSGPRDWNPGQLGPGARCVDTNLPFEVSAFFPVDQWGTLTAMEITLTQHGKDCPLWVRLGGYGQMAELNAAFAAGMTPVVSYKGSGTWMDGRGADGRGPCVRELPDRCGRYVRFYNFSVTPALPPTAPPPRRTSTTSTTAAPRDPAPGGGTNRMRRLLYGAWVVLMLQAAAAGLWAARCQCARRGHPACPAASCLQRSVAGSSQNLLAEAAVPASSQVSEVSEASTP